MSQRNKPSPEALRTAILRRSVSAASTVDSALESDAKSGESREETPDSDSGYNATVVAVSSTTTPLTRGVTSPPGGRGNAMFNELRMRQQQLSPEQPQPESTYVNLATPAPVPNRDQKPPHASRQAIEPVSPTKGFPKGGVAMPGFGGSPLGSPSSGPSLADQLKSRLEERRRSKESIETPEGALVPERIAQDIEQAVKIANENGKSLLSVFLTLCTKCAVFPFAFAVRKLSPPSSNNTSNSSSSQFTSSPGLQQPQQHRPLVIQHPHLQQQPQQAAVPQLPPRHMTPSPPSSVTMTTVTHQHHQSPPRHPTYLMSTSSPPRVPPPYPVGSHMHPGGAGHVPYSPAASTSSPYRQPQYPQQNPRLPPLQRPQALQQQQQPQHLQQHRDLINRPPLQQQQQHAPEHGYPSQNTTPQRVYIGS